MDLENIYYNAKALKEDDLDAAYEGFQEVLDKDNDGEDEKGEWGFKAKKQMIKVLFEQGKYQLVLEKYNELLSYLENNKVTGSYAEKSFSNMLDHLTSSKSNIKPNNSNSSKTTVDEKTAKFVESIYVETLRVLVKIKNERIWIKTNLKLAKLYSDQGQVEKALNVLTQIQNVCLGDDLSAAIPTTEGSQPKITAKKTETGLEENNLKSSYLMEVYAQMITIFSDTGEYNKVMDIYVRTMNLSSAVSHPRIMGVIQEAGGKIQMRKKQYEQARQAFFDSFRNYDEAGSLKRISVLKYYVLSCMLSGSKINPFESQETRPYRNNPQINTMVQLVEAFQRNDTDEFQKLITNKTAKDEITDDPFILEFIEDIILYARSLGIVKLVKPYTRVKYSWISKSLDIPESLVREILMSLIYDGKLPMARLDSRGKFVELRAATLSLDMRSTVAGNGFTGDDNVSRKIASAKAGGSDNSRNGKDGGNSHSDASSSGETGIDGSGLKGRKSGIPGGIAPLLDFYQVPTTVFNIGPSQSLDNLASMLTGPSLLPTSVSAAMAKSSNTPAQTSAGPRRGARATTQSNNLNSFSANNNTDIINLHTTINDTKQLFTIPGRYVQAMEDSKTVASSQQITKDGSGSVGEGTGDAAGQMQGQNDRSGEAGDKAGGSGDSKPGPGNSLSGPGSGSGIAGGGTGPKSLDAGYRAGSIDPNNPYSGQVQQRIRTQGLLSWARSVDTMQQVTQKGKIVTGMEYNVDGGYSSSSVINVNGDVNKNISLLYLKNNSWNFEKNNKTALQASAYAWSHCFH